MFRSRRTWVGLVLAVFIGAGALVYLQPAVARHPDDDHDHDNQEVVPTDPVGAECPLLAGPPPVVSTRGVMLYEQECGVGEREEWRTLAVSILGDDSQYHTTHVSVLMPVTSVTCTHLPKYFSFE